MVLTVKALSLEMAKKIVDAAELKAIGVSGANPELDGICAQAGLDSISSGL